jgi:hypothetical protein
VGNNIIDENGTRHSAVIELVATSDDTKGNHTVCHIAMSAHSHMKLKMQYQELKSKEWEIIKHAK